MMPIISNGGRCRSFSISSLLNSLLSISTSIGLENVGLTFKLASAASNALMVSKHRMRQSSVNMHGMK